jgi:hypothetical protein
MLNIFASCREIIRLALQKYQLLYRTKYPFIYSYITRKNIGARPYGLEEAGGQLFSLSLGHRLGIHKPGAKPDPIKIL